MSKYYTFPLKCMGTERGSGCGSFAFAISEPDPAPLLRRELAVVSGGETGVVARRARKYGCWIASFAVMRLAGSYLLAKKQDDDKLCLWRGTAPISANPLLIIVCSTPNCFAKPKQQITYTSMWLSRSSASAVAKSLLATVTMRSQGILGARSWMREELKSRLYLRVYASSSSVPRVCNKEGGDLSREKL